MTTDHVAPPGEDRPAPDVDELEPDGDEGAGAAERMAARLGGAFDPAAGWTTPKVVLLVVVAAVMSVLVALTAADRVSTPGEDSVDVGFLRDMIHHHEQAIQLGVLGNANAGDEHVAHFALEAIITQQYEIGYMEALLDDWGHDKGDPDRDSMVWMNMPTPIEYMPGMAPQAELDRFRDLSGRDADEAFLRLMTEHHRGGIHMANYARDHAADERVAELAGRMSRNQSAEIAEYAARARALDLAL